MKTLLPILVIVGLLVATVAMAAPADPLAGIRVHAGYVKPLDFDGSLVYGADYIWKNALATVNYFAPDDSEDNFWTLEGSYIWRPKTDLSWYYGAGLGVAITTSSSESGLIWNGVVGKEFWMNGKDHGGVPYAEARYTLGSTSNLDDNIDGLRVTVGWRF